MRVAVVILAILLWSPSVFSQSLQRMATDALRAKEDADQVLEYLSWARDAADAIESGGHVPSPPTTLDADGHVPFDVLLQRIEKLERAVDAIDVESPAVPTHPVRDLGASEAVRRAALHDAWAMAKSLAAQLDYLHKADGALGEQEERVASMREAARTLSRAFAEIASTPSLPEMNELFMGAWVDVELTLTPRLSELQTKLAVKHKRVSARIASATPELANLAGNVDGLLDAEQTDLTEKHAAFSVDSKLRALRDKAGALNSAYHHLENDLEQLNESGYDRCPHGHDWAHCTHEDLKQAWKADHKRKKKHLKAAMHALDKRRDKVEKRLRKYDHEAIAGDARDKQLVALLAESTSDRTSLPR